MELSKVEDSWIFLWQRLSISKGSEGLVIPSLWSVRGGVLTLLGPKWTVRCCSAALQCSAGTSLPGMSAWQLHPESPTVSNTLSLQGSGCAHHACDNHEQAGASSVAAWLWEAHTPSPLARPHPLPLFQAFTWLSVRLCFPNSGNCDKISVN